MADDLNLSAEAKAAAVQALLGLAGYNPQTGLLLPESDRAPDAKNHAATLAAIASGKTTIEEALKNNPPLMHQLGVTHNAHASGDIQAPTTPNHAQSQSSGAVLA